MMIRDVHELLFRQIITTSQGFADVVDRRNQSINHHLRIADSPIADH